MTCALWRRSSGPSRTPGGVPARQIATAIPPSGFLSVDGTLDGAELKEAFTLTYPKGDAARYFIMEDPIHDEGRTWIVTKMLGPEHQASP